MKKIFFLLLVITSVSFLQVNGQNAKQFFKAGEEFLFLGRKYPLIFSEKIKEVKLEKEYLCINKNIEDKNNTIIKWYKKAAKIILSEQICKYEKITGLKTASIKISSAKRRWGSCGSRRPTWPSACS
jgi:predicted metal-dependent hydrolase